MSELVNSTISFGGDSYPVRCEIGVGLVPYRYHDEAFLSSGQLPATSRIRLDVVAETPLPIEVGAISVLAVKVDGVTLAGRFLLRGSQRLGAWLHHYFFSEGEVKVEVAA